MRVGRLRWCVLVVAATIAAAATVRAADGLELSFDAGRVTVVATDIPLRTILNEWARLGDTIFVDADRLSDQPVSVEMLDVPEREALRVLLRAAGGYLAAPRAAGQPGAAVFDRVVIMATPRRRPPRQPLRAPSPFGSASGQPGLGETTNPFDQTAPPGLVAEPDDPELDELELLEQLRGRYQPERPAPDPFSQPAPTFFPSFQPQGDPGGRTTPRPGMFTAPPNERERSRRTPVPPQTDDR